MTGPRERSAKHCEVDYDADGKARISCHRCGASTDLPTGQLPWVIQILSFFAQEHASCRTRRVASQFGDGPGQEQKGADG